jgi:hypothetical protein
MSDISQIPEWNLTSATMYSYSGQTAPGYQGYGGYGGGGGGGGPGGGNGGTTFYYSINTGTGMRYLPNPLTIQAKNDIPGASPAARSWPGYAGYDGILGGGGGGGAGIYHSQWPGDGGKGGDGYVEITWL